MQLLLNVGGPDRVSRVQMAEAVASVRGYNASLINPVSASSVCFSKDFCQVSLFPLERSIYWEILSWIKSTIFPRACGLYFVMSFIFLKKF